jgi:hypothetical protein
METAVETRGNRASMDRRTLKRRRVLDLLRSRDLDQAIAELGQLPGRRFLHPLRSALCSDEIAKWHAVTVMGILTADLADRNLWRYRLGRA